MDEECDTISKSKYNTVSNRQFYSVNENSFKRSKPININHYSTIESDKICPKYDEYEDCRVYSRSAPNQTTDSFYLENYISKQKKRNDESNKDEGYKIIGTSPGLNNSGTIYGALNKSVNTLKNFFNF